MSECPVSPEVNQMHRRRTAKARREQKLRSENRMITRLMKSFKALEHRGCCNTKLGHALKAALENGDTSMPTQHTRASERNQHRMPLCRHFAVGKCTWGNQCRFHHLDALEVMPEARSCPEVTGHNLSEPPPQPHDHEYDRPQEFDHQYDQYNKCSFSDDCRFKYGDSTSTPPARPPMQHQPEPVPGQVQGNRHPVGQSACSNADSNTIIRQVPVPQVQTVEKEVEVPQMQPFEKLVPVSQVSIQEVVVSVPEVVQQEVVRQVLVPQVDEEPPADDEEPPTVESMREAARKFMQGRSPANVMIKQLRRGIENELGLREDELLQRRDEIKLIALSLIRDGDT